jgi:hypothetical protein
MISNQYEQPFPRKDAHIICIGNIGTLLRESTDLEIIVESHDVRMARRDFLEHRNLVPDLCFENQRKTQPLEYSSRHRYLA